MELRILVITILVFSAAVFGMSGFLGDLTSTYNTAPTEDLSYLNRSQELINNVKTVQNKTSKINVGDPLTWGNVVGSVVNIFGTIFKIPLIIHGIIVDMSNLLLLPDWTSYILYGIVLVIVVFEAVSAINKYKI